MKHKQHSNSQASNHTYYFETLLDGIDTPTLPFGNDGTETQGPRSTSHRLLDRSLQHNLFSLADRLDISPEVLFHAALSIMLARTSSRSDVLFGTAGALGTADVLPFWQALHGLSVVALVDDSRQQLARLSSCQAVSEPQLKALSGIDDTLPLFGAVLDCRTAPSTALGNQQTRISAPLTLTVRNVNGTLELTATSAVAAERMLPYMTTALTHLLDALQHRPATPAVEIQVLPPQEWTLLLDQFNDTAIDYPDATLVHAAFEQHAAQTPDRVALSFEGGALTYDQLNRQANRLAHYLLAAGVRPDDRVAICLERSPQMVTAMLAVLKAGGGYMPMDPSHPASRLRYMLEDAQPKIIITQQRHLAMLDSTRPHLLMDDDSALADQPETNPDAAALNLTPRHLAYVIYTSGSTGRPKGVMIEHRSVQCLIMNRRHIDAVPSDVVAHCANTAFDAASWEIWSALLKGAQLHIVSPEVLFDPQRFIAALTHHQVTALCLTTGLFHEYLDILTPVLGQLRYLSFGGDAVSPRKIMQLQAEPAQPEHVVNLYGPSEMTAIATSHVIREKIEEGDTVPIGRPINNTRAYILDTHLQPVPVGVTGELYFSGPNVARGYLNLPEKTDESFLPDPFVGGQQRMYKSGDLGRWREDGTIDFLGRNDHQVKIRGFRIELGDIEHHLAQHEGVREVVVHPRTDMPGGKQLVAYLIAEQRDTAPTPNTLRDFLSDRVTDYMIPSAFVTLDMYPLTPNGKLDLKALPVPDADAIARRPYEAPQGDTEHRLAEIWQTLLNHERIGRGDNFFELGGHSLLVVKLFEALRDMGKAIDISTLFAHPVLSDMATAVEACATSEDVLQPGEYRPLVTMRTGQSDDVQTFFFIPGAAAASMSLAEVIMALPNEPHVYAFETRGVHDDTLPHFKTIEEAAECYVEALKTVRPEGPYQLAGHSFGGWIAFEMALRLQARGEQVEALYLFNSDMTMAPDAPEPAYEHLDTIMELVNVYGMMLGKPLPLTQEQLAPMDRKTRTEHLFQALSDVGIMPLGSSSAQMYTIINAMVTSHNTKYSPTDKFHGTLTYFCAQENPPEVSQRNLAHWQTLAGQVTVHHVPGNHMTMLTRPHVEVSAQIMGNGQHA